MGWLTKALLIYLFIAVAVTVAKPNIIFDGSNPSEATALKWFNIKLNSTSNQVYYDVNGGYGNSYTSNASTQLLQPPNIAQSGNSLITYADSILMGLGFITLITKFAFSPIIILVNPIFNSIPISILLFFGIPLVFIFIWGIVQFIRGVVW